MGGALLGQLTQYISQRCGQGNQNRRQHMMTVVVVHMVRHRVDEAAVVMIHMVRHRVDEAAVVMILEL